MATTNEMNKHALCGPSSAHRWLECPGSIGLSQSLPPLPPSVYAEEGTRAHTLAERLLQDWLTKGRKLELDFVDTLRSEYEDTIDSDGVSMVDHVLQYVNLCIDFTNRFDQPPHCKPEVRVTLHDEMAMYGTADFVATGTIQGVATGLIVDLKYGRGIEVETEGNPQLGYYASALSKISKRNLECVVVSVVQPRLERLHTEIVYDKKALGHWHGVLTRGAEKALMQMVTKKYELKAGAHCRFCPAKGVCSTHASWLSEQAGLDFAESNLLPSPLTLTPDRIGKILSVRSDLTRFLDAVEERALSLLSSGVSVPGYKVVAGRRNRRWKQTESETADVLRGLGLDPYDKKLKSPAQVEKAIKPSLIAHLVTKPEGSPTIAPESDSRPALTVSDFLPEKA
jgi:hypothetical protein